MKESLIQAQLFKRIKAAAANHPEFELIWWYPVGLGFAVRQDKNGRTFSPQANKAKAMGLKKDLPDIHIMVARGGYHGAFLELKQPGEKPRPSQAEMLKRLNEAGYQAVWADDLEKAWNFICIYLQVSADCWKMKSWPVRWTTWEEVGNA